MSVLFPMTATPAEPENPRTLIDELLVDQQRLTAVGQFAKKNARHELPAQARYYRALIPLTKPARGEQYAFAVDLDLCTGCKACVSACHSLNGLDDDEIWRDTGLLHGGTVGEPYQQTVTTACHHCVEPACLNGCPVKAYEKDEKTGIVRHLDDQCIGCQYCVLKCPYDVPKYSKKRGIVRKCDLCHGRLAVGEAPACVQACPSGAITIRIVEKAAHAAGIAPGDRLLPGAFDSDYTKPATAYTSRRPIPANAQSGDSAALRLEHAHWPLIWMLILTQVAAGIHVGAAALALGSAAVFRIAQAPLAFAAFIFLNLGLAVSVLHLGRPLGAWRAFLGLRTSWMSREILAFGIFAACAAAFTGAGLWEIAAGWIPDLRALESFANPARFAAPLAMPVAALGLAGVFCSAMLYVDTRRVFWSRERTFTKFFGAALLLGSAGTAALLAWAGVFAHAPLEAATRGFAIAATILRVVLSGWEFQNFQCALNWENDPNHRSALVMWNLRRPLVIVRAALFVSAALFGLPAICGAGFAVCATFSFLLTLAGEIIGHYFFFTAVIAPRMPGPPCSPLFPHA